MWTVERFKDEARFFGQELKTIANPFSNVAPGKGKLISTIGVATILATFIVLGLATGHVGQLGNLTTNNIATITVAGLGVGLALTYFVGRSLSEVPSHLSTKDKFRFFGSTVAYAAKPIHNKRIIPLFINPQQDLTAEQKNDILGLDRNCNTTYNIIQRTTTVNQSKLGNFLGAVGLAAILATLVFFSLAMANINLSGLDKFGDLVTNNTAAFSAVGLVVGFATTYVFGKSLLNLEPLLDPQLALIEAKDLVPIRDPYPEFTFY